MTQPIVYVARFVPDYRRPILEELNRRLGGRLIAFAGTPPKQSFSDLINQCTPNYTFIELHNRWFGGDRILIQPVKPILESNPKVILAEESPRTLSLPLLLSSAKKKEIGTLVWGHFSSNKRKFSRRNPQDFYRTVLAKKADGCVCYTNEIANLIQSYVPTSSCFVAQNTLDTQTLFHLYDSFNSLGKSHVRSSLGIAEKSRVIVFIGRLIPEKRPEVLLDLYKAVSAKMDTTLIIIGDGPERDRLTSRIQNERLNQVFLVGSLPRFEDSAPWMYASDMMVCPGYVGLNINHAFCFGLPVVTYGSPNPKIRYHSPEIAYLEKGVNGMVADSGNIDSLVQVTLSIFDDLTRFSTNAYHFAKTHLKMETMIDGLMEAINYAELCSSKK